MKDKLVHIKLFVLATLLSFTVCTASFGQTVAGVVNNDTTNISTSFSTDNEYHYTIVYSGTGALTEEGISNLRINGCREGDFTVVYTSKSISIIVKTDSLDVTYRYNIVAPHVNGKFLLVTNENGEPSVVAQSLDIMVLQDTNNNILILDTDTCN